MGDQISTVLLAFAVLSVKHMVADFFLQTPYQFLNKGTYGHPGGLLHSGLHVLLTLPVFLVLPPATAGLALAILAGEFVVHYHIDWAKEQLLKRYAVTPSDAWYWHLLGLDQLGHYLTYVAIVAFLAR